MRISEGDVINVVNNCSKQRFNIQYESVDSNASASNSQVIFIRASQGHSLSNVEMELDEITNANAIQNCIHGTYHRFWDSIKNKVLYHRFLSSLI